MRTAECKSCGWTGDASELVADKNNVFSVCPKCNSVELIIEPSSYRVPGDVGTYNSKEHRACTLIHTPRTIIAEDQRQAQIECSMVQMCPAQGCSCFLDSIIRSLADDGVLTDEETSNLIYNYGGDEDEQAY